MKPESTWYSPGSLILILTALLIVSLFGHVGGLVLLFFAPLLLRVNPIVPVLVIIAGFIAWIGFLAFLLLPPSVYMPFSYILLVLLLAVGGPKIISWIMPSRWQAGWQKWPIAIVFGATCFLLLQQGLTQIWAETIVENITDTNNQLSISQETRQDEAVIAKEILAAATLHGGLLGAIGRAEARLAEIRQSKAILDKENVDEIREVEQEEYSARVELAEAIRRAVLAQKTAVTKEVRGRLLWLPSNELDCLPMETTCQLAQFTIDQFVQDSRGLVDYSIREAYFLILGLCGLVGSSGAGLILYRPGFLKRVRKQLMAE